MTRTSWFQRSLMAAASIAFLALLASCGGDSAEQTGKIRLVVYSPHGSEILGEMEKRFEAAEPGINFEWQYLSQDNILAKLRAEKDNPYGDVWWGGTTEFFDQAVSENLLQAYRPSWADAVDARYHHPQDYYYGQFLQVPCILFNNQLLDKADAPKDWDDLLAPQWKGRLVVREPLASGTMKTIYSALILRQIQRGGTEADGFAWLKRLDGQTDSYLPSPEAMFDKVAKSPNGYISLWNLTDALFQSRGKGYPFDFTIPAGPVPVSVDPLAIAASSQRVEAARAFYEYATSAESAQWLAEKHFRLFTRDDLPEETQPEWRKDIQFTPMDIDWPEFNKQVGPWMEHWRTEIRDPKK